MNLKLAFLVCALCAAAAPSWAEKADAKKPIEISADNMTLDQLKGVTTGRGSVVINQGTLHATADEVVVTRDAAGRQTLHATGNLATFRQKMGNSPEYVDGVARQIDYTSTANLAVLTGSARIKRGQDVVQGEKITYNTQTEVYQVMGGAVQGPNKGRVTVILQPRDSSAPGGTAKEGSKP